MSLPFNGLLSPFLWLAEQCTGIESDEFCSNQITHRPRCPKSQMGLYEHDVNLVEHNSSGSTLRNQDREEHEYGVVLRVK